MEKYRYSLKNTAVCLLIAGFFVPAWAQAQDNSRRKRLLPPAVVQQKADLKPSPEALQRMSEAIQARRTAKQTLTPAQRKLNTLLLDLIENERASRRGGGGFSILQVEPSHPLLNVNAAGVLVGIRLEEMSGVAALEAVGVSVEKVYAAERMVVGRVPVDRLEAAAALDVVADVQPVTEGITNAGSVTSGGVGALNVDQARSELGLAGAGVKVAVISDGTGGLESAQASGDLPGEVELCPLNENAGAEGTAMLEIVYDMAPEADLAFCSAFGNGPLGLADAIFYLANEAFGGAGADVIVDDVGFLTEPYFEDGPIAQAVDAVAAGGVAYFSSAGNAATNHYERPYIDASPGLDLPQPLVDLHNFGQAAGLPGDVSWSGVVAGEGNFFAAFLQWTEPFGSAGSDYDLYLFDQNGIPAGDSTGAFPQGGLGLALQDGDDAPLEMAFVVNDSSVVPADPVATAQPFFIVIDRFSGSPNQVLEMNFNGFFGLDPVYNVPEGSVWGHSAAQGAVAVAAISASDPGLDDIEPFSSRGPSRIFFPAPEARQKPDVTAVDNVLVTGAGGFPSPFLGTSAAAPHAAGIAALLQEAAPGLGASETEDVLERTARDRGAPGGDAVYGAGLIDAFAAASAAFAVADETPPMCGPINVERGDDGALAAVQTSASDPESGIASVAFTTLRNLEGFLAAEGEPLAGGYAEGDTMAFDPNAVEQVRIRGERLDAMQGGAILATVTNGAGRTVRCDPVVEQIAAEVPQRFALKGNAPNPFRTSTRIGFDVAEASDVRLSVFDVLGRRVAVLVDEKLAASHYEVKWDGRGASGRMLSPGVYLYRLKAGNFLASERMVLVR